MPLSRAKVVSKRSVICNQGIACYCTCISSFSHKLNLLYCKRSADAAEQHKKVQKVLSYDT